MPFEHHTLPLLSRTAYLQRVLRYTGFAFILLAFSLGVGLMGYKYLNDESWLDALVDASMFLTGMGPVSVLKDDAVKWFASFYSIFSGVAFFKYRCGFLFTDCSPIFTPSSRRRKSIATIYLHHVLTKQFYPSSRSCAYKHC